MVASTPERVIGGKVARSAGNSSISVENVTVEYHLIVESQRTLKGQLTSGSTGPSARFQALKNVSCRIEAGEVVGILGRNGSGKSTLLKVMSGVIKPTAGTVRASGKLSPLLELGAAMNAELTGRENVILNGALMKLDRQQINELIPEIQAFAEIGPFFDLPIKTYSSGMVSRLAFAMSTQISPDILIVDEVLAVGDEQFSRKCFARMKKLMESGSIVIFVSHSTPLLEQLCQRGIYLKHGEVVFDGAIRDATARYRSDQDRG